MKTPMIVCRITRSCEKEKDLTQPAIVCSKVTIEALEQSVKYVHK